MGNLVDFLCEELTRVEAQTNGIPQLVEHGMAGRLLTLAFGYDWYDRRIKFRASDPDDWMLNGSDAWLAANPTQNDVRRIVHTHRVIRLADAVYTLIRGGVEGFDAVKDRFLSRPTKPCFIETEIASLLVCNGFRLKIIKETGVRGEDFDMLAMKDSDEVSVEVTSKVEGPLTVQTISNTLHAKRDQVPPGRPAVLYIHVPAEWTRDQTVALPVFTDAVVGFLKRSKRFNAIGFVSEEVIPFGGGGFPSMSMRVCFNEQPRHPFGPRHLFEVHPGADGQIRMARSFVEDIRAKRATLQAVG